VTGNEWFRSLLDPGPVDDEQYEQEEPPPSYDGGVRTSIAPPAPDMSTLLRRARNGGITAGDDDRDRG